MQQRIGDALFPRRLVSLPCCPPCRNQLTVFKGYVHSGIIRSIRF